MALDREWELEARVEEPISSEDDQRAVRVEGRIGDPDVVEGDTGVTRQSGDNKGAVLERGGDLSAKWEGAEELRG